MVCIIAIYQQKCDVEWMKSSWDIQTDYFVYSLNISESQWGKSLSELPCIRIKKKTKQKTVSRYHNIGNFSFEGSFWRQSLEHSYSVSNANQLFCGIPAIMTYFSHTSSL